MTAVEVPQPAEPGTAEPAAGRHLLQERVRALSRLAGELTADRSVEGKLRTLAHSVVTASGAAACSVSLFSEEQGLDVVETFGFPDGYDEAHRQVWQTGAQDETERAFAEAGPVVTESLAGATAGDPRYRPLLRLLGPLADGAQVVVPLLARDEHLGVLHVYYRRPGPVHADELSFLVAMADHGAIAVEHTRLLDEAARTALLEERQRLSRELHDSVSQTVYAIALGARTARALLDTDPDRLAEPLDYVLTLAEAGLAELRALIFALRPESLEREGLVAALDKQLQALRVRHELDVQAELCLEPDVGLEHKEAVYRIAQEALHNVVKHARASMVRMRLLDLDEGLRLVITDDGTGFDPSAEFPGHLGLRSMAERAAGVDGLLALDSQPGAGTTLTLTVPRPGV